MQLRRLRPITRGVMELPAVLLREIDDAWERSLTLPLHFEVDPATRRVRAELRRSDGTVAERLSARQALLLACGDARSLAA
jgi:hypothetical protein